MRKSIIYLTISLVVACNAQRKESKKTEKEMQQRIDTIIIGGGCFWCMEAVYQRMDGIIKSESGYCGGHVKNPAYREVCNGTTGHAEVVQLSFDTNKTSLEKILAVFFAIHDPTSLNKQGEDKGPQYRSIIFYRTDEQKKIIEKALAKLNDDKVYSGPIVTEVLPFEPFYKAEDYHQNYYNENSDQPYCQIIVKSKVDKFEKLFSEIKK